MLPCHSSQHIQIGRGWATHMRKEAVPQSPHWEAPGVNPGDSRWSPQKSQNGMTCWVDFFAISVTKISQPISFFCCCVFILLLLCQIENLFTCIIFGMRFRSSIARWLFDLNILGSNLSRRQFICLFVSSSGSVWQIVSRLLIFGPELCHFNGDWEKYEAAVCHEKKHHWRA